MKKLQYSVKTCNDCPLFDSNRPGCFWAYHEILEWDDVDLGMPEWCPLLPYEEVIIRARVNKKKKR